MRNSNQIVKDVADRATHPRDIIQRMAAKKKEPGHPFPVPPWWLIEARRIRRSMSDTALIRRVFQASGRIYSKFQITRYFQDENPSTTLELTEDLWRAFAKSHGLPRPFAISHTPDDAKAIEANITGQVDAVAAEISDRVPVSPLDATAAIPTQIQSDGASQRTTLAGGRLGTARRRP